jgi:multidrug resistance efflux pump
MIAVISIVYGFCVWILFAKLKWAKPRPVPIAVAAVIGVVLLGVIIIAWDFSAPLSTQLVASRHTVQLVPQVNGQIKKIHAKAIVPLKKDEDILFEINPDPYVYAVDQFTAELAAAGHTIQQNDAAIRAATANVAKSEADFLAAQGALDVGKRTAQRDANAISELRMIQLTQEYEGAQSIVDQAKANAEQARFGLKSAHDTLRNILTLPFSMCIR